MNLNSNRTIGFILIGVGAVILLARFIGDDLLAVSWPLWIIVPGVLMLFGAFNGQRANLELAIPGAIVTGTGLILATMAVTGRWEAWAYAWALYPAFSGVAMYMVGQRNGQEKLRINGQRTAMSGLYMLIGFGLFFEIFIFGGLSGIFNSTVLPLILLAAGAYFVWSNGRLVPGQAKEKRKVDEEELV